MNFGPLNLKDELNSAQGKVRDKKKSKENFEKSRREYTIAKYQTTQARIEEIDKKIERLKTEKNNLLQKQEKRRNFLYQSTER